MPLRAGSMRKRITLQTRTTSVDASGGQTFAWRDVVDAWAEIIPASGREQGTADAVRDVISHVVTMRYIAEVSITPKDRMVFGTRVFNIVSVANVDERNRQWEIMVQEGLNLG